MATEADVLGSGANMVHSLLVGAWFVPQFRVFFLPWGQNSSFEDPRNCTLGAPFRAIHLAPLPPFVPSPFILLRSLSGKTGGVVRSTVAGFLGAHLVAFTEEWNSKVNLSVASDNPSSLVMPALTAVAPVLCVLPVARLFRFAGTYLGPYDPSGDDLLCSRRWVRACRCPRAAVFAGTAIGAAVGAATAHYFGEIIWGHSASRLFFIGLLFVRCCASRENAYR